MFSDDLSEPLEDQLAEAQFALAVHAMSVPRRRWLPTKVASLS